MLFRTRTRPKGTEPSVLYQIFGRRIVTHERTREPLEPLGMDE